MGGIGIVDSNLYILLNLDVHSVPKAMRLLYAVQFEVASSDRTTTASLGAEVLTTVTSWISGWYADRKAIAINLPLSSGTVSPIYNHEITLTRSLSENAKVSHNLFSWSYPDDNDGNLFWHARIEIGEFNDAIEFSLQLSIDSTQYLIAPFEFKLRRPRIVGTLLRQFNCFCGDVRLSLEQREVKAEDIEGFASTRLFSGNRRLPIVLVSRTVLKNKWLVDPSELSDLLAGIAETYCLADKWAAFALTDVVGKRYSCFNGAVRVYWPDFNPAESPYSPIYLSEKLSLMDGRLPSILFQQIAAISAFRYVTGPITTDSIEQLQLERHRELDQLKAAAADRGDLNELLNLASSENSELLERNNRLRQENDLLKASLELAIENFRAMHQSQGEAEAAASEAAPEEIGEEPKSIEEAVTMAKDEYGQTLVVQDTAIDSARNSPFVQYKKVYQALLAMHEVCLAWRLSRKTKTPMGSFEHAFAQKGFDYKPRESMTSRGKWGNEYETSYKTQRVSIEQHLALGKGGPDTCLRIHFYTDEQEEKFVIAHVGRHKTNTRS